MIHTYRSIQTVVALAIFAASTTTAWGQFNYVTDNDTITITKYTGLGGDVTIPGEINGLPVTSIGDRAFFDSRSLTSVTIPNSVTNIGEWVFAGLYALGQPHDRERCHQHQGLCVHWVRRPDQRDDSQQCH